MVLTTASDDGTQLQLTFLLAAFLLAEQNNKSQEAQLCLVQYHISPLPPFFSDPGCSSSPVSSSVEPEAVAVTAQQAVASGFCGTYLSGRDICKRRINANHCQHSGDGRLETYAKRGEGESWRGEGWGGCSSHQ